MQDLNKRGKFLGGRVDSQQSTVDSAGVDSRESRPGTGSDRIRPSTSQTGPLRGCQLLTVDCRLAPKAALAFNERLEPLRARRVAQLAQRLGLDLADALARDLEVLADLFQRVVALLADAEAHAQNLFFA